MLQALGVLGWLELLGDFVYCGHTGPVLLGALGGLGLMGSTRVSHVAKGAGSTGVDGGANGASDTMRQGVLAGLGC